MLAKLWIGFKVNRLVHFIQVEDLAEISYCCASHVPSFCLLKCVLRRMNDGAGVVLLLPLSRRAT